MIDMSRGSAIASHIQFGGYGATRVVEVDRPPGLDAALPAARDEAAFAASLCEHPLNTLLAVDRHQGDGNRGDGGIIERFHVIRPAADTGTVRAREIIGDDPGKP